jgi:molybdate transport system substrate-binding protein
MPAVINVAIRLVQTGIARSIFGCVATLATLLLFESQNPLHASEVRLLSAASIQKVFKEVVGDFERPSGHQVIIHYGIMSAITDWIRGGEQADLVISSLESISTRVKESKIEASSETTISKVGVGIVLASGSTIPPVRSVEDLSRALLPAKTIIYADPSRGGAAGIHIARVIQELGIADQQRLNLEPTAISQKLLSCRATERSA